MSKYCVIPQPRLLISGARDLPNHGMKYGEFMATTTVTRDQDAVIGEIEIAAPPERIFKALSDESELKRWFTNPECPAKHWTMDSRLGGRYGYATEKGSVVVNAVSEFECHGEITEYDPPRVLAYTWIANWHDDATIRTVVRWELTPISRGTSGGTHVKVTHSGLSQLPVARKDYSHGWIGVLDMLKSFAEAKNLAEAGISDR
jgi:uncharacterized protein YndB with AHSA1/START domain